MFQNNLGVGRADLSLHLPVLPVLVLHLLLPHHPPVLRHVTAWLAGYCLLFLPSPSRKMMKMVSMVEILVRKSMTRLVVGHYNLPYMKKIMCCYIWPKDSCPRTYLSEGTNICARNSCPRRLLSKRQLSKDIFVRSDKYMCKERFPRDLCLRELLPVMNLLR